MTHFTEAILAASKRNAAGGQKRPALRVGRIGAPGALRRLPDARIAPGRPLRPAPTRATRSAPMKCVIVYDLWYKASLCPIINSNTKLLTAFELSYAFACI
jgi:hypothetical protein